MNPLRPAKKAFGAEVLMGTSVKLSSREILLSKILQSPEDSEKAFLKKVWKNLLWKYNLLNNWSSQENNKKDNNRRFSIAKIVLKAACLNANQIEMCEMILIKSVFYRRLLLECVLQWNGSKESQWAWNSQSTKKKSRKTQQKRQQFVAFTVILYGYRQSDRRIPTN